MQMIKPKPIIGILLAIAIIALVWFYAVKERVVEPETGMFLEVSEQSPKEKVIIDRVRLQRNGWVVARGVEGERLGQVIEISRFLPGGTHAGVEIPLGEFYQGEDLVAMIYEDQGDSVFNDLDLPALDENGRMVARYVRTGDPLPANILGTDASMDMAHNMPGMAEMARVRYTDEGFFPALVEVPAGTMVEFVNESSGQMWVASDVHPGHEQLPTFDQFRPYAKGGVYRYTFDKPGAWTYHDHLNPADEGTVTVK